MGDLRRGGEWLGAASLGGLAAMHAAWGLGSSWPLPDRASLAQAVAGRSELPSASACFAVATALSAASALVAGAGGPQPVAQCGRLGVAAVLGVRGLAGVTGQTHRLVRWRPDDDFVARDRRWLGPLCLALAASALSAAASQTRRAPSASAGTAGR